MTSKDTRQIAVRWSGFTCCVFVSILAFQFLKPPGAFCQDDIPEQEYLPAIATSGTVEIEDIRITRWRASRQARHADLTNMTVSLWLASNEEPGERILLQVTELDPVHDNTGKLLTTKPRLDALKFFKKDFRGSEHKQYMDKNGPVIHLLLDAPAREATSIKAIKGKAVVSEVESVRIDFKDLKAINNKALDDPQLKDFKIKVELDVVDGDTELKLEVPPNHERLMWWGLVTNARKTVPIFSEGQSGNTLLKSYRGDQVKGTFLGIIFAQPKRSWELEFDFKDIDLP